MGLYKMPRSPFWWYSFKCDGRRIRKSTGLTDKKQAKELYLLKRGGHILGKEKGQLPPITLKHLLGTYLEDYSKTNKLTYNDDCSIVNTLNKYFGDKLVSEVTPQLIEQYKAYRRQTPVGNHFVSGARVNRDLAMLKQAYNKGIDWGLVLDNPIKRVKFFNEKDRSRTRYLTPIEKERLLNLCTPFLRRIVLVALKTGMRQAELLNLRWTDIDFNANQIVLKRTKSGRIRYIPLHPDVLDVLQGLPKSREYVFFEANEARWWHGKRRLDFDAVLDQAGIRDFRFHDLRHTFASELVMKGADIKTVSELLGHATTRMTERYSHLSASHKGLAINLLASEPKPTVRISKVISEVEKQQIVSG